MTATTIGPGDWNEVEEQLALLKASSDGSPGASQMAEAMEFASATLDAARESRTEPAAVLAGSVCLLVAMTMVTARRSGDLTGKFAGLGQMVQVASEIGLNAMILKGKR